MKKFVAILLTLMLVLGIGAAVADEGPATPTTDLTDHGTVTIKKVYKLVGAGTSPAETFTLEQVGNGSVKDGDATSAPALGIITGATFAEGAANANGATGEITVALPKYTSVGVYEYTLQEVAGTTAGVTYYGETIKLVVTVVNGKNNDLLRIAGVHTESSGVKSDTFANTYRAGTLNVTKTVAGNLGDQSKKV
ncbi:MAG: Spy0128 family protein [Lachnospiraceae bacterium]